MAGTAATDQAAQLAHASAGSQPRLVITFDERDRATYLAESDLARLRGFAEPHWIPSRDGMSSPELLAVLDDATAIVVCHGWRDHSHASGRRRITWMALRRSSSATGHPGSTPRSWMAHRAGALSAS